MSDFYERNEEAIKRLRGDLPPKTVDEMTIAELFDDECGNCGNIGLKEDGTCEVCGDVPMEHQIEKRRQWLREHPLHASALYAAAQEAQEIKAHPPVQESFQRLTPEDHEVLRKHQRARQLRGAGLARLLQGEPCTPTQAPFVGEHVRHYEDRIKELQGQLQAAHTKVQWEQERLERVINEWNEVWQTLEACGLRLYENEKGHGWQGAAEGETVEANGYLSIGEALEAALRWRIGGK